MKKLLLMVALIPSFAYSKITLMTVEELAQIQALEQQSGRSPMVTTRDDVRFAYTLTKMQLDVAQIKDDKEVEQVIREKFLPFDIQIMVFPQENLEDRVGMHLERIASMRSLPIFNCFSDQLLNLESIYVLLQSRTTGYDISLEPGDEGYDSEIDQLLKKWKKSFNSCVDLSENFQAAQKAQK